MRDLSIIIPVKDEPHKIVNRIARTMRAAGAEVIVVDDGSNVPNPKAILHHMNKGYGAAILTGLNLATRKYAMTMDGDGQHTPKQAKTLYKAFKLMEGVDMLIGARRLKSESFVRLWGRKGLNLIASAFAGYYFQDLNSGMRIFDRKIALGYEAILCKQFSLTTSMTMSFKCDNYNVETFPIIVNERSHGKSHVRLVKHGFITLYYILRIGCALRTRGLRAWMRSYR